MTGSHVPPELLDSIVAYFDPQQVILFGPRRVGGPSPAAISISLLCSTMMLHSKS